MLDKLNGPWTRRLDLLVLTGVLVGLILGLNFSLIFTADNIYKPFHIFMCLLFVYHILEFTSSVYPRPYQSSLHDFMLFHSPPFMIAFAVSVVEYFIEVRLFPDLKSHIFVSIFFTVIAIVFQYFRSGAMYYAGSNFNHYIETEQRVEHILVTDGLYTYLRHPSYFGWFWWSIATQIVMLNPVSTVLYALAAWYFFYDRIPIEESYLTQMFGEKYTEYKKRTIIGIPFLK
ncbi:protein-S-isoprenylcysteine O-methyltransferase, putative [Entamoeba invadens IP1]|uniref:Protein-S-isoprenylcysteine O-methyltransferase n=1 Tax=Entamoeba invadens IP1 TaxID=370355 RepID=A0A0A1UGL4_ENTIV|nr:protein-S-isoprenylcysteine O-methyltransferase, putative [Entamoeba invadens IP1]ELP92787.1 protein-S-isoprenylcysteine O-methyltransferase, putative [Entamoeba invadens IP1]|eukprot:XP_004259558.1 protein-S-isoprenylcysteine O-methyltransferase, putative [Entamoeba invadens IP1]